MTEKPHELPLFLAQSFLHFFEAQVSRSDALAATIIHR